MAHEIHIRISYSGGDERRAENNSRKNQSQYSYTHFACNGIHFCTFPAALFLFVDSFPLLSPQLVPQALSVALDARSVRNENEPQKSFVRASVTFDIRAFFYAVTFFSVLRGFHVTLRKRQKAARFSRATSTNWRLSPKFLFLPLPSSFLSLSFSLSLSLSLILFVFLVFCLFVGWFSFSYRPRFLISFVRYLIAYNFVTQRIDTSPR